MADEDDEDDSAADEAQEARFRTFMAATSDDERDWIAFLEFEQAIERAAQCAAIVNPFDDSDSNVRERDVLRTPVAEMFFRALAREVNLGPLMANAESIGYAIRFGLVEATPQGLDGVADDDALDALASRGDEAIRADMTRVEEENARRLEERDKKR